MMDVLLQLAALSFLSLSVSPSREQEREGGEKNASIGRNWLLFEVEYWSPSLSLPPPGTSSHPSALLTSPAATLISAALNGVPSSVQTSSWINGSAQTLCSRFGHTGGTEQQLHGMKPAGGFASVTHFGIFIGNLSLTNRITNRIIFIKRQCGCFLGGELKFGF